MKAIITVCLIELRRIVTLRPAFSVLILVIIIYSVFYPQPYRNEALHNVPIALVDLDGTDSSRQFARRLDAAADIGIGAVLPDVATAERAVYGRRLYGVLVIPKHFERDLLHGRASPVALYADASYFLIQSKISGAVQAVAKTLGAEVETSRLIAAHIDPGTAAAAPDPMRLTAIPLFNPQGGYATYILPAAFVLLLQQTLLIGVGLLGTYDNRALSEISRDLAGPIARVLGKLLAYVLLEAIVFPFYLIVLPYLYGIPRLGTPATIFAVALPFMISVAALGMVVARLFRTPIVVQMVSAAIGMPFMFLAGFSWPTEAMPPAIHLVALAVPSTSAINALVNVGQLGASLFDVREQLMTLSGLAAFYLAVAVILEFRVLSVRRLANA